MSAVGFDLYNNCTRLYSRRTVTATCRCGGRRTPRWVRGSTNRLVVRACGHKENKETAEKDSPFLFVQRENYRAVLRGVPAAGGGPRISDERIARLDALGLCWNVRETKDGAAAELLSEKTWNANMRALVEYREKHGDCLVPQKYDATLANWVGSVRRAYKAQQKYLSETGASNMESAEEAASSATSSTILYRVQQKYPSEAAAFNIESTEGAASSAASSTTPYKAQQTYPSEAAASNIESTEGAASSAASSTTPAKDMPFGKWLTPSRIEQLQKLHFVWSVRDTPEEIWNGRYESLRAFKSQFGHCRVPAKYDKVLNQWIFAMRHYYKNTMDADRAGNKKFGKLSADKIFRLQRLGFEWEVSAKDKVRELIS